MKKSTKRILALVAAVLLTFILFAGTVCFAEGEDAAASQSTAESARMIEKTARNFFIFILPHGMGILSFKYRK